MEKLNLLKRESVIMNKQTSLHTQKTESANPFLNAAIVAAVALAILPAAIFGAVRCVQSRADASSNDVEVEEPAPKRLSVAERRAQRLEARRAKEAKEKDFYPEITMETVEPYYDGFGTDYDADMDFDGFGMMPPAYMGSFNEFRRMPGAERGFDNGFGRGRGNFRR